MHCLGGVVRAKTPTLFAADFACGQEPMFCRRICRPDGLAPNKKGKARNMSSPTGLMSREPSLAIFVTRTHAANSAEPIRRYRVAKRTGGGPLFSAVGMCGR